jgi:hypothetical protein
LKVLIGPASNYEWPNGDIIAWQNQLPEIDANIAPRFLSVLRNWAESKGYTIKREALPTGSADRELYEVDAADSPLVAHDMQTLTDAVNAIDINADSLSDRASWIALMHGIKGASGGNQDFYLTTVEPWLLQQPDNAAHGPEWCQTVWNGIHHSSLGADYVYAVARAHGWSGYEEMARSVFDASGSRAGGRAG